MRGFAGLRLRLWRRLGLLLLRRRLSLGWLRLLGWRGRRRLLLRFRPRLFMMRLILPRAVRPFMLGCLRLGWRRGRWVIRRWCMVRRRSTVRRGCVVICSGATSKVVSRPRATSTAVLRSVTLRPSDRPRTQSNSNDEKHHAHISKALEISPPSSYRGSKGLSYHHCRQSAGDAGNETVPLRFQ